MIRVKRVYDPPTREDGERILVERLWPRGLSKQKLKLDHWLREAGPSTELRKWFSHDPGKWEQFQRRYRAELAKNPVAWQQILDAEKKGNVTLLFSSRDTNHNNAVALKSFLDEKTGG